MQKITLFIFVFILSLNSFAQNNPPPRSPLDPSNWGVVYDVPGTKKVEVKKNVIFMKSGERNLAIDIYTPPGAKQKEKFPAVVFLNAIGDYNGDEVKEWAIYSSFPRLVAAHGMIGISMNADGARIQETLQGLFGFLEKNGARYGIDANRLGVYAASANVGQSMVYLMSGNAAKGIRAAALFYGAAPAPDAKLRKDLPVLFILPEGDFVRAGQPQMTLWQQVAEARAPWTLMFANDLPHAFDAFSDNDESRRIIQQAIAFWKSNLEPVPQPPWKPSETRAIVAALYGNDAQKKLAMLEKYVADNSSDGDAYFQYGRALLQLRRNDQARAAFEKALSLGANHGGVYFSLGQIGIAEKRWEEAAQHLTKALEIGAQTSFTYGQLAYVQMMLNRNEDAIKSYERAFEIGISPGANTRGRAFYNMACAYVRLKQNDKAFELLDKAVDEGFNNRQTFETDTDLDPVRADARFQKILERLPKAAN